jgi:hypothetical protein
MRGEGTRQVAREDGCFARAGGHDYWEQVDSQDVYRLVAVRPPFRSGESPRPQLVAASLRKQTIHQTEHDRDRRGPQCPVLQGCQRKGSARAQDPLPPGGAGRDRANG